jgi:hypothetical protein
MLGEEQEAGAWNMSKRSKTRQEWSHEKRLQRKRYWIAIRANRQLANELREQGLNEYARMFGYRAQILWRKVLWLQAVQSSARIRGEYKNWVLFPSRYSSICSQPTAIVPLEAPSFTSLSSSHSQPFTLC